MKTLGEMFGRKSPQQRKAEYLEAGNGRELVAIPGLVVTLFDNRLEVEYRGKSAMKPEIASITKHVDVMLLRNIAEVIQPSQWKPGLVVRSNDGTQIEFSTGFHKPADIRAAILNAL